MPIASSTSISSPVWNTESKTFCITWKNLYTIDGYKQVDDSALDREWTSFQLSPHFRTSCEHFSFAWHMNIGLIKSKEKPACLVMALYRVDRISIPVEIKWRCTLTAAASDNWPAADVSWGGHCLETFPGGSAGRFVRNPGFNDFLRRFDVRREFTISLSMIIDRKQFDVLKRFGTQEIPILEASQPGPSLNKLRKLCDSEEFTDFKLSTLDGDICAHKAILAGSSPYFQTLFAKHNAQQYKNERHSIQVPYGKSAVKAVIQLMYTDELDLPDDLEVEAYEHIIDMLEMYNLDNEDNAAKNTIEHRLCKLIVDKYDKLLALKCVRLGIVYKMHLLLNTSITTLISDLTVQEDLYTIAPRPLAELLEDETDDAAARLEVVAGDRSVRQHLLQWAFEKARCEGVQSRLAYAKDIDFMRKK